MAMVSRAIMGLTSSRHKLQDMVTKLLLMDSSRVTPSRAMHSKVTMDMVILHLLSNRVISKATVSKPMLMDNLRQGMVLHSPLMEQLRQLQVGMIITQQQLLLCLPLQQLQQQHLQLKVETCTIFTFSWWSTSFFGLVCFVCFDAGFVVIFVYLLFA
jgi:hypothetical protein